MRISATTLESFRLYMSDQDWMSEADIVASILGQFTPSAAVKLGKAFGEVLETPDQYRVQAGYAHTGHFFSADMMTGPLSLIDRRGVFEAKAVKAYGPHDVVAKADHLLGSHLSEFKTTLSAFDVDKYTASYQWRFMADIFQPSMITYRVFCLSESDGVIDLKSVESFNLFPYDRLHADCCDLLAAFVDFATAKGLAGALNERQRLFATEAA